MREANGIVSDGSETERRGELQRILCTESVSLSMTTNKDNELDYALSTFGHMDHHMISQV